MRLSLPRMVPGRARIAVTACAVGFALAACSSSSGVVQIDDAPKSNGIRGTSLQTPMAKPAMTLTDTSGKPYNLRTATAGKVTFVYFGYTHCPDVCPTTMADLGAVMTQLKPAVRAQVAVVFITTDPARDTSTVLRTWLNQFNTSFVGLTGTWNQINAYASQMDVPLDPPVKQPNGLWTVDHGAAITAFEPDGLARDVYLPGMQVEDYVHDIPLLMKSKV